jgi:hypothetical protein
VKYTGVNSSNLVAFNKHVHRVLLISETAECKRINPYDLVAEYANRVMLFWQTLQLFSEGDGSLANPDPTNEV